MDNTLRAANAAAALAAFEAAEPHPDDVTIRDLIADLLHLAAARGLDPLKEVRRAIGAFADERDFPEDGWADEIARVMVAVRRGDVITDHSED